MPEGFPGPLKPGGSVGLPLRRSPSRRSSRTKSIPASTASWSAAQLGC